MPRKVKNTVTVKVSKLPPPAPQAPKVRKRLREQIVLRGRGDYRPTSQNRVVGRGDYLSDIGRSVGGSLGHLAGGAVSSLLSPFTQLLGMGDYRTKGPVNNTLFNRSSDLPVSHMSRIETLVGGNANPLNMGAASATFGDALPRVTHREYVGPVLSNGSGFNTTVYRIQPGLRGASVLFPWGSSVAQCFQQYRLEGAILEYQTTSSDYATGSALGSVSMSTLYNAASSPLATILAVNNNEFTTTDKPSSSFIHPIECAPSKSPTDVKYVRSSNSPDSSDDDRLDDIGIFQISTNGLSAAAGTQIGELWISYDITFLKPALPDLHSGTTFLVTSVGSAADADMLPDYVIDSGSSLPVTVTSNAYGSTNRLVLPVGYNGFYMVLINQYNNITSGTPNYPMIQALGSDLTAVMGLPGSTGSFAQYSATAIAGNNMFFAAVYSTIAENKDQNFIDFGPCDGGVGIMRTALYIIPLDNDLVYGSASTISDFIAALPSKTRARLQHLIDVKPRQSTVASTESCSSSTPPTAVQTSPACSTNAGFVVI